MEDSIEGFSSKCGESRPLLGSELKWLTRFDGEGFGGNPQGVNSIVAEIEGFCRVS